MPVSRFISFLPMLILIVISSLANNGKKAKKTAARSGQNAPAAAAPARKMPVRLRNVADAVHWRTAREVECAYGEVNHRYSHNTDRRVAQLDSYLKAGLIDRKEYAQMLERYHRMDREAGLD